MEVAGWCRCRKAFGEDAAGYNMIFSYFFAQNQQFGVNKMLYVTHQHGNI